jgi:DNA-damage-inducible protein J
MGANALVQTRINADVRDRAAAVLEKQGMTVSDAVRIMLTRTANEGVLPLAPKQIRSPIYQESDGDYDTWFRARVQEALDDPRPPISSEEFDRRWQQRRTALLERVKVAKA